ncbi:MAG: tRNA (guanine(10)-N(2))-dimethyltransferase [Thermoprotei archaeon]|nr:MAG: tRNA (guanine(10)-N(2))-dimethyltransferase [Thermoprotei archaeon]
MSELEFAVVELEKLLGVNLVKITEGLVELFIPDLSKFSDGRRIEPCWAPVFYNPRMVMNRDISVLAISYFAKLKKRNITVCEPLSATGVRGLRYAKEVPSVEKVVLNDIDFRAYKLILLNTKVNNLEDKVEVHNEDANILLHTYTKRGERFDVVDIDPFGSPVPFTDAAIRAVRGRGLLCLTATDLAPLLGVYPKACLRKYGAIPLRTDFSPEIGVRIMLGYLAREAAKHELGIKPLLAYIRQHYMRVFVEILTGASSSNKALQELGYLLFCRSCLWRALEKGHVPRTLVCPNCGSKLEVAGPLWCGPIFDRDFVRGLLADYESRAYMRKKELTKFLSTIVSEVEVNEVFYTTSELASRYRVQEPSVSDVVEKLRELGYKACRTHFSSKGFRTDAPLDVVSKIVRELSPK